MASVVADHPAEQAVLGALLVYGEPSHVRTLQKRGLKPEHFYWQRHRSIFECAIRLAERDARLDPITISSELEGVPAHEVDALAGCCPAAGNLAEYAELVRRLAIRRGQRRLALQLLDAIDRRHDDDVEPLIAHLGRSLPSQPDPDIGKRTTSLKVISEEGEIVRESTEERDCPGCLALKDQLQGAEKDIKAWRTRHANLKRDQEADAQKDALWLVIKALHDLWRNVCKHLKSEFGLTEYKQALPYVKRRGYGVEMCERAIAGAGFQPTTSRRLNGTVKRHDDWELIFRNHSKFEEFCNRAPLDWKPMLGPSLGADELARRRAQKEAS